MQNKCPGDLGLAREADTSWSLIPLSGGRPGDGSWSLWRGIPAPPDRGPLALMLLWELQSAGQALGPFPTPHCLVTGCCVQSPGGTTLQQHSGDRRASGAVQYLGQVPAEEGWAPRTPFSPILASSLPMLEGASSPLYLTPDWGLGAEGKRGRRQGIGSDLPVLSHTHPPSLAQCSAKSFPCNLQPWRFKLLLGPNQDPGSEQPQHGSREAAAKGIKIPPIPAPKFTVQPSHSQRCFPGYGNW